jgi:hypothetical protein
MAGWKKVFEFCEVGVEQRRPLKKNFMKCKESLIGLIPEANKLKMI